MIPRTRPPVEEDDPFDFPDLPDSFSDQNQPSRTPSSSHPPTMPSNIQRKNLHSTVLGSGPNGVGVITKLNTKSKPSTISHGSIKLKNKAVAKTWEDELDFEGDWGGTLKLKGNKKLVSRLVGEPETGMEGFDDDEEEGGDWKEKFQVKTGSGKGGVKGIGLGMPVKKVMPGVDALDDLDFDMDNDNDADVTKPTITKELQGTINKKFFVRPPAAHLPSPDALDDLDVFDLNEDEATIKAGPAMKALLPPPRIRPAIEHTKDKEDDLNLEMDDDFALPLNLTNLTLATRSAPSTGPSRARTSIASNNTDWNSPTSQSQSDRREGWDSTPPSKRLSETSATSLSDGLNSLAKNTTQESVLPSTPSSQVEEEDMEDGLVMPSKHFFSSKRELNSLLDRKRRPEFASPTRQGGTIRGHPGHGGLDELTLNSEGLEDGLVFEDPKAELTRKRLTKSKEARSQIPIPTRRSPNGKPPFGGDGRGSPYKDSIRERTQSTVGLGHRSHSTGNTALLGSSTSNSGSGSGFKPFSPTRPRSPTLLSPSKERSRSGQAYIPLRLPVPTPQPKTPPRSSGLRHQKSSSHLQTSPTHSGLSRKQSLSSLQDPPSGLPLPAFTSVSSLHSLAEEPTRQGYATSSTSRLTNPTSASKAKTRPPLHGVFPMTGKISGLPAPSNSGSSATTRSRLLHAHMKRRPYGDGTELEAIEDLEVGDEDKSSWKGSGSGRSKGSIRDRPSLRSVFSPEKKTKSVISNPGQTPKGKERGSENRNQDDKGSWGRRKTKRTPLLIKHLGAVDKRKVVGDMTWNPTALRWEGNESALHDFDHVPAPPSARPALITHTDLDLGLTAKNAGQSSPTSGSHHTASGTVRIVGNMQFDPKEMRWISIDPEDEIDPFGDIDLDMADDEDEERGGTIRANGHTFRHDLASVSESDASSTRHVSGVSSLGGRPGQDVGGVSEELKLECKMAEERHRREMRGWVGGTGGSWSRSEVRREEKRLWEIRHLAQVVGS